MTNHSEGAGRRRSTDPQAEQRPQPAHQDDWVEHDRPEAGRNESERLLWATFDRAVIGIAHTSPDGRWLRCNQRLCDLLGYSRDELATRTFQDLTHPDDLAATLACHRRLLAGELDADELDKRYVRKDGAAIWIHVTLLLVRTPDGVPDYVIVMAQDITERTRLEQERARLLEWERAARREAEAANTQLQALQALTDSALSHLALDDLLDELLGRVTAVLGVDNVGILLWEEDGQTLTLRAARGLLEEVIGRERVAVGQGLPGRVAASRAPLIANALSAVDFEAEHHILQGRLRSLAGVPLLVEDQVDGQLVSRLVGVLGIGSATPRHFTEADVHLLQRAAERIAVAVDRARLYAAEQEARQQAQASEAHAAERAERLRTILETMADGVAVYDAEGRPIQLVNRAYRELFALDRGPAEYESMTTFDRSRLVQVRDSITGAPLPFADTPVGRALRGEVVTGPSADIRARAFDGRELELNTSAAPLREPDGRIEGVVLVLRDMSERNRLAREREAARADELAAREASRRMEAFLAVAAHDLRTPLTATVGFLDLAERHAERLEAAAREGSPDLTRHIAAMRSRLEDAEQSTERLRRLLALLFDTAAIRAGKLELHRAPLDLAELVREQLEALRAAAPQRTVRLHLPREGAPVPVEADADRIGQVITNFVTNALKYSPSDRPVEVTVAAHATRARLLVCDQGSGIPKAEQAHVWELFHRVPGVSPQGGTHGGSLGLGLHICKAIITAHGGRVGVKSSVGHGSTFWFTLPLAGSESRGARVTV